MHAASLVNKTWCEAGSGDYTVEGNDEGEDLAYELGDSLLEEQGCFEAKGKKRILLSLWDFGGQCVFYTMHSAFLTRYGVYCLVFKLTEFQTQEKTEEAIKYLLFWLRSVQMHAPDAPLF